MISYSMLQGRILCLPESFKCKGRTHHIHDAQDNSQLHCEEDPFPCALLLHVEVRCVLSYQLLFL